MKDAARRESWCELQNTQIIDVPNVHDGRKSNGQVRFSVKTKLLYSRDEKESSAENLFELFSWRAAQIELRLPSAQIIRYWARGDAAAERCTTSGKN